MIELAWILTILLSLASLYFAPALIAQDRHHCRRFAILAVNLLFGWTVVGWGLALVWAVSSAEPQPYERRIRASRQPAWKERGRDASPSLSPGRWAHGTAERLALGVRQPEPGLVPRRA